MKTDEGVLATTVSNWSITRIMHERSLVKALIEQVAEQAKDRQLGPIHEIELEIGEFSGVEPQLVQSAFEEMSIDYWKTPVRLIINVVPLTAMCTSCHATFVIQSFRFVCPLCDGVDVKIESGEEMRIKCLRAERESSNDNALKGSES